MNNFDPISDKEIKEYSDILLKLAKANFNDADKAFIAELSSMRRLVDSQTAEIKRLLDSQDAGQREVLKEQKVVTQWQIFSTVAAAIATVLALFGVIQNAKLVDATMTQVAIAKKQLEDATTPRLYVETNSYGGSGVDLKNLGRITHTFSISNQSDATAFDVKCGVLLIKDSAAPAEKNGNCPESFKRNQDFTVQITRAELYEMAKQKKDSSGIFAYVSYWDGIEANSKGYQVRRRMEVRIPPDGGVVFTVAGIEQTNLPRRQTTSPTLSAPHGK